tara:strand:+ start:69 stop:638 length:570 start_codon:yes stop_codon:yes gene_type:complete
MAFSSISKLESKLNSSYVSVKSSWSKLDAYVNKLRERNPSWPIWGVPLNPPSCLFELFKNKGWEVGWKPSTYIFTGSIEPDIKTIWLKSGMHPYERDKTLSHEFAHLFYPDRFGISGINSSRDYRWEAIIEWLGRQWRAKPTLLRTMINTFELEAKVYDWASQEAFKDYTLAKGQLVLPLDKRYTTIMD